ncbi:hypothetical protein FFWV33_12030 [Flavobacterium faecale]|uniref:Uncharacterized protein n=1 Tax=Flavobacterium faecale TaxID=1355330 RepID=A0A2S1LER7_9FLAO|nr:hypothetical protein [Flavobacterium faecale]AWG22189.1 hypothetical protein FFWV33_12030 [Flavobacterium faecale]
MKSILTLLLLVTVALSVQAQSPEKMSYQAIIRAQDNSLVVNSRISLRVLVHQTSASGATVYQETHSPNTNNNGLVSLEIGTGKAVTGSFSSIAWQNGPYFIETQVDPAGGSNYSIVGITQLLSVPYALHAKTAERLVGAAPTAAANTVATPYRATLMSVTAARSFVVADVNNTIACTTTATLTLPTNFSSMAIGDTVNLEAHNGAILTIQAASGVSLNYKDSGTASFSSAATNVTFGFLRKTGDNSYIISGQ